MARGGRGGQRATIRDVASHAGVSVATVSRVLSGTYQAPAETRDRVMQAVQELDYVLTERTLSSLSGAIAVIMNTVTSPFFMNIAAGIEEQAFGDGRVCLFSSTKNRAEREVALVNMMRHRGVEAVILVGGVIETPTHRAHLAAAATALDRSGARMVLCGRTWSGPPAPVTVVDYDSEGGAFAATNYLLSQGHRRIAHLGGPADYTMARQRVDGYRRALVEFGIEPDPKLIFVGGLSRGSGYESARQVVEQTDATAMFAANDFSAAGAIAALRDAGLGVPDDYSVMGFDDVELAQDVYPQLTTVHVPQREIGRVAARLALHPDPGQANQRVVLGTHVVVRDSVRHLPRRG